MLILCVVAHQNHPKLIPLSQKHHHTLSLCAKILRAPQANYQTEIVQHYADLEAHFQAEEAMFAPLWDIFRQPEMRQRFEREHAQLRQLYREAEFDNPEWNVAFATQLRDHARFEERELFEQFQAIL